MKLFYKKKLISELRKIKEIKADDDFKGFLFRQIVEIEGKLAIKTFEKTFSADVIGKRFPLFTPVLIIIIVFIIIGAGAGITFASQFSLPGEVLYPLKIASEKARIALVADNNEKAMLYFEFSSKRLAEIAELANDSDSNPELAAIAVKSYKEEINKGQAILFSDQDSNKDNEKNKEKTEKAADLLAGITSKNKETIAEIGSKTKNYKIADSLKDAWEDTVEYDDKAAIITLSAPIVDSVMKKKVFDKITEAENKISEADKNLFKKGEKGFDVSEAQIRIGNAKELIGEAKKFFNEEKYENAFNKAKEAYKAASATQKNIEKMNGNDNEDNLEMFKIYYTQDYATTSDNSALNQPALIIHQIENRIENKRKKNNKEDD